MAGDETIDLTEPVSNARLLREMVGLRRTLKRERWHKRILALLVLGLIVVSLVAAWNRHAITEQVGSNRETIQALDEQQRRLDGVLGRLDASGKTTNEVLCQAIEGVLNASIDEEPAAVSVKDQWQRQARIDQYERDVEANLAPIGCDLHLHTVLPPGAPLRVTPPKPAAPVSGSAPSTPPPAGTAPTTTTAPPRVTTTTRPPVTTTTTTLPVTTTTICKRRSHRC